MQQTAHKVVVIGHRTPDTDSICSAIAYAELKNKTSDLVCEARRAGKMNQETEFVLKKFGVTPPRMCTDVNPKIRDVDYRQIPGISGSTSLRKAWEIMRDKQIDTLPVTSPDNELEGVITVNKVLSYAQDYLKDNETYSQWAYKQDGASQIARLLFEEATDINFFVGRAINPAHQNPDLPINFSIKMNLVKDLCDCLQRMGKRVKVSYF
mgnify:CR=1 FL=1